MCVSSHQGAGRHHQSTPQDRLFPLTWPADSIHVSNLVIGDRTLSSTFWDLFPKNRRHLIGTISGSSIIEEMSANEFRQMIIECLTGRNPRIHTENWAQAKIYHGVFTGIEEMFAAGKAGDKGFISNAPKRAAEALRKHHKSTRNSRSRLQKEDIVLCQWVCNLTSKGWDNILQANPDNLVDWGNSVVASIGNVSYGDIEKNIVNMALYNASLAKKGGVKSAMGNLFESLLLYSSLTACGVRYAAAETFAATAAPCFTLNVNEGRQSDAQIKTGLAAPGKIDIDIGFIGKGNPEIIADKTQRFGNLVGGGEKPLDDTIIVVSAIPETESARLVVRQATLLGATVITMSGNNWVHDLSEALRSVGISGLREIPSDVAKARAVLDTALQTSEEIIAAIPKDLAVPTHWTGGTAQKSK